MAFTMKGTRTKPNFSAEGLARKDKAALSMGYIEFPLLVRLRFNNMKTENDGLWLDFGPSIGFLLYQKTVQRHHVSTPAGTSSWEMCGTTILTSIGLSFLFLRGLLMFSNDTMAYHFASAIRHCQLAFLNMKLQVESSRNTTIPRFIWYIPFSFEHLRLFKTPLWRCVLTPHTIPHHHSSFN